MIAQLLVEVVDGPFVQIELLPHIHPPYKLGSKNHLKQIYKNYMSYIYTYIQHTYIHIGAANVWMYVYLNKWRSDRVWMYVCMYVCIYVYIHYCTYINLRSCIYTYILTYIHTFLRCEQVEHRNPQLEIV